MEKGCTARLMVVFLYISTPSPNFIKISIKRGIAFNSTKNVILNMSLRPSP